MELDIRLIALAGRQFGLVTRAQLLGLGCSRHQIDRRISIGMLVRVQPSVYLVAGMRPSYEARTLAPVLAVNALAAVSHRSAARLLGLRGNLTYNAVDITVAGTARQLVTKASVHRSRIFDRYDVHTTREGIPITRPERTVIGCAALDPRLAGRVIDAAIHGGFTTYDRLWRYLSRYSGPGCPGSAAVKEALMRRNPRERPPESTLEDDWIEALALRGVTGLVKQLPVPTEDGDKRLDLGHAVGMFGFEIDSKLWHASEEDYRADRRKRYLLAKAGYRIFPVTEFDLHERVDAIAADALIELRRAA